MSKVDAMRALREARRAASAAGPDAPRPRPSASAAARPAAGREPSAPTPAAAGPGAGAPAGPPSAAERCGHRNLAGRSCTREPDHVQRGTRHRYG